MFEEPAQAETSDDPVFKDPEPADDPPAVTLTEVADDRDLFDDPDLEVARMAPGDEREIIVPVEIGDEETGFRRFKLAFRLRLDPVE